MPNLFTEKTASEALKILARIATALEGIHIYLANPLVRIDYPKDCPKGHELAEKGKMTIITCTACGQPSGYHDVHCINYVSHS